MRPDINIDNISNAKTPNYRPKLVTFEEQFQTMLEGADHGRNKVTKKTMRDAIEDASRNVVETGEITRRDDNGVKLTEQMIELMRNAYQLQYVYQSINSDFSALRAAIVG